MAAFPVLGFPVAAFPAPGFPAAAFPVPGFPVAAVSMPGLPAAGISVAALQLAMSPEACAAVREALASVAGTHSIAADYSSARSGAPIPSNYGRSGRYGYYGAAAAGAAAGYAYGRSYGGETYAYNGQSCYRTVRYQTRSGWRKRVVDVCE